MGREFVIVTVACASRSEARKIANSLLKKRLVACANIFGGVESTFWWKGRVDKAKETLVVVKTKKANFKKVEAEVKRLHSYKVPEIIALPIIAGSEDYLNWIKESVI